MQPSLLQSAAGCGLVVQSWAKPEAFLRIISIKWQCTVWCLISVCFRHLYIALPLYSSSGDFRTPWLSIHGPSSLCGGSSIFSWCVSLLHPDFDFDSDILRWRDSSNTSRLSRDFSIFVLSWSSCHSGIQHRICSSTCCRRVGDAFLYKYLYIDRLFDTSTWIFWICTLSKSHFANYAVLACPSDHVVYSHISLLETGTTFHFLVVVWENTTPCFQQQRAGYPGCFVIPGDCLCQFIVPGRVRSLRRTWIAMSWIRKHSFFVLVLYYYSNYGRVRWCLSFYSNGTCHHSISGCVRRDFDVPFHSFTLSEPCRDANEYGRFGLFGTRYASRSQAGSKAKALKNRKMTTVKTLDKNLLRKFEGTLWFLSLFWTIFGRFGRGYPGVLIKLK